MIDRWEIEPERYELTEPARYHFELHRRDFLKVLTALGGGLLVVAALPEQAEAQESGRATQGATPNELGSWLHIAGDGRVTAFTGKVEIGQNIRTSLAQVVSDELRVPMASITFIRSVALPPKPPCWAGTASPSKPISANVFHTCSL